jgi:hypothetical protein
MKKQYINPVTEIVKLNVSDAVLQEIDIVNNSTDVGDEGLGKENNPIFEDDDIWNNGLWGSEDENTKDLWGDN